MATASRKPKYIGKYLPQCHLIHYTSQLVYPAGEDVTQLREIGVCPSVGTAALLHVLVPT